jgi:signal transduction histidine kinase
MSITAFTRLRYIFLAATGIALVSGCALNKHYYSVPDLSRDWAQLRKYYSAGEDAPRARLEEFRRSLNGFLNSREGVLYVSFKSGGYSAFPDFNALIDSLQENGPDRQARNLRVEEIDEGINRLTAADADLSNLIQLRYFQLFIFFCGLVIISVIVMTLMGKGLEKALRSEELSRQFSRETVTALEKERSRIARELHDTVAQDLWRLTFRVKAIQDAKDPKQRDALCGEVSGEQRNLTRRIRSLCDTLVPPVFSRRGLHGAVRSLAAAFAERSGVECAVTVGDDVDLSGFDGEKQLQCYRIVQEALANIEKHAGAENARVSISREEGVLRIEIADDGAGFDGAAAKAANPEACALLREDGHYGVWSMFQRAAALGGKLSIESGEGPGTKIILDVPPTDKNQEGGGKWSP